ncbi:MAG: ribonuclease D [Rickettsiales bacterium]|nr:ribonuclease D [Rickettsiales bacterium]
MSSEKTEITMISSSEALKEFCFSLKHDDFITVDTEFLRDKTYYPVLCLIQIAGKEHSALIDVLAEGIDLAPVAELMQDQNILKVFHAASQDIEIFYKLTNHIPSPIFDTQIAAMVCGYGDAVGYSKLVESIVGASVDKKERFTNWSQRPLTHKQQQYALSDVTYLRDVYVELLNQLEQNNRLSWLKEEIESLTNPESYQVNIDKIWRKINTKSLNPRFLMLVRAICVWREESAKRINIPRNHIFKEHVILELAASCPTSKKELRLVRGIGGNIYNNQRLTESLLGCIAETQAEPKDPGIVKNYMSYRSKKDDSTNAVLSDMFKLLLKHQSEAHKVAPKLLSTSDELNELAKSGAGDKSRFPCMRGWRYEILGQHIENLVSGKMALSINEGMLDMIMLDSQQESHA